MPIRGSPNGAGYLRPQAGRDRPESVVAINRNARSQSIGIAGRDRPVRAEETWIKTNMAPLRGWGPKGEHLRGFAPHGRWRTLTVLGALRCDRLTAPCVFDGPINGECFRAYVEQQLLPVLKTGDIVIMDNLGSHKSAALRRVIKAAGASRLHHRFGCISRLFCRA
jgi:hypothetical protein